MHLPLLFLLLLISQVLVANEPIDVLLKVKQKKNELHVKVGIKNNIISPELAKRKNIPLYYIPSIIIKADENTLASAYLSPYFGHYRFINIVALKFRKKTDINMLHLLVTDSNAQIIKKSKQIKHNIPNTSPQKLNKKFKAFQNPSSTVTKATNSQDAIKALYGLTQTIEGNFTIEFNGDSVIKLDDGMCNGNGGHLNMSIKSDIKLNSLAIFQDANKYSTIAIFHDNQSLIYYYKLNFSIKKTSLIRVVGRGIDGILYESQSKMYVIPGSHRDCYGNVSGPYMVY